MAAVAEYPKGAGRLFGPPKLSMLL